MVTTILFNFMLSMLGILILTFWESKKYFFHSHNGWIFSKLLSENFEKWLLLTIIVLLISVISGFYPEYLKLIKSYLGIDLIAYPIGFLTLGLLLNAIIRK